MTTNGPEFGNPLRKFKLVFLGEQSGKLFVIIMEWVVTASYLRNFCCC